MDEFICLIFGFIGCIITFIPYIMLTIVIVFTIHKIITHFDSKDNENQNLKYELERTQRELENLKKDTESDIRRIHNAFDNVVFKRKDEEDLYYSSGE